MIEPEALIDPMDPLLSGFALQHDLRERFLHALEEILAVRVEGRHYRSALDKCREIARDALSEESILLWHQANRPLPWLDEQIGDRAESLRSQVTSAIGLDS